MLRVKRLHICRTQIKGVRFPIAQTRIVVVRLHWLSVGTFQQVAQQTLVVAVVQKIRHIGQLGRRPFNQMILLGVGALVLVAMTFVINTLAEAVRIRFRKRAVQL